MGIHLDPVDFIRGGVRRDDPVPGRDRHGLAPRGHEAAGREAPRARLLVQLVRPDPTGRAVQPEALRLERLALGGLEGVGVALVEDVAVYAVPLALDALHDVVARLVGLADF